MGGYEPEGGDADRMLDVETRLRTEITDIDALLTTHIADAQALAPDAAVPLGHAVSLVGTFCQETGVVADAMLACRQALGFADGAPPNFIGVIAGLNQTFTDADGATDAPETLVEDIEQRVFGDGERPDGNEYVEQLLAGVWTDAERQAIWDSLSPEQRRELIKQRPDLGLTFLDAGALSADELEVLDDAISYTVSSTELELTVDGKFDVKIFTITVGGGVAVTIQELSDGTFKVLVGANAYAGVSRELDTEGVEVSAELRAVIESGQVMQFEDIEGGLTAEEQILAAVNTLEQAIEDDANDVVGTGRYVGGVLTDVAIPLSGISRLFGGPSIGQAIDGDQRPESIKALEKLMEDHGTSRRIAAGAEGSISGELDAVGLGGLEASAKVSIVVYDVEGLNGETSSNGVVVAGSASGSFSTDSPPLVPGTANGDITGGGTVGFSSDTNIDEHGNVVTTTTLYVETSVGTVGSVGLGDVTFDAAGSPGGSSIEVNQSTEVSQRHTVTITTPINSDTDDMVADAVQGLAGGDLDGVYDLYDASDVVVTSEDGVRVAGSVKVDLEVIEVEVTASETNKVTTNSHHKPAGGEFYDQIEANESITEALGG